MYNLSKDYKALYLFVENGNIPIAFVDYEFSNKHICRDVCRVKKSTDNSINFTARGIGYGGVDIWLVDEKKASMKIEFIKECQRLNVEWILP